MNLRAACLSQDELDELSRALAQAGLPFEDLREPGRAFFAFEDDRGLIGYGGWEGRGPDRLLRSFLISPARRGRGCGRLALAELEEQARQSGTRRLHLLTTAAASFFGANGYCMAERSAAPDSVRATREFSTLCPATACYMVKLLAAG